VVVGRASSIKIKVIKMGDEGDGSPISPDGVAPSRIASVSGSDMFCGTIKSRRFLLAPAHPGNAGKRDVKRLCVCSVSKFAKHTMMIK